MEWFNKLAIRALTADAGFGMDEDMIGEHEFAAGRGPKGKHPFSFRVTWGPKSLKAFLAKGNPDFMRTDLKGKVTVGGLCENVPCEGSFELRYFDEHKIRYTFEFKVKAKSYLFVGEKVNIQLWNLPVSHTTCFGTVTEKATGALVSKSVTYFRFRDSLAFLSSFRLKAA